MEPPQPTTIEPDSYHQSSNAPSRKSSRCFWISLSTFLALLSIGLLVAGGVIAYKNRDVIRGEAQRIVLLIFTKFYGVVGGSLPPQTGNYDYSPSYLRASLLLQSNMNRTADPCEDFFEFSCGKFVKEAEIPGDTHSIDLFTTLQGKIDQEIQRLMESHKPTTSKAIEKMRSMYRKCLDFNSYGEEAIQKAYQLIQEVGYFPMLQGDAPSHYKNFDWAQFMMKLADKNFGLQFISLRTEFDLHNKSNRQLALIEMELRPSRSFWLNQTAHQKEIDRKRAYYQQLMTTFAQDVGIAANPQIDDDVTGLFEVYSKLAPLTTPDDEWRNSMMQQKAEKFSRLVDRFKSKTGLDLREWIRRKSPEIAHDFLDNEDLVVNVRNPDYVDKVIGIIKSTPARTLLNLHQLEVLSQFKGLFPERYRDIELEYDIYGRVEKEPRWKDCMGISQQFTSLMSALYVRNHYSRETMAAVQEMIDGLKESFREIVEAANWMDHDTKQKALYKSKEMLELLARYDDAFVDAKLDAAHAELTFSEGQTFLEMVEETSHWLKWNAWRRFLGQQNRRDFDILASMVNAVYSPETNAIIFPAAIQREPFFDGSWPKALNYGGIGTVIGHEITHGFDDSGKQYDHEGNMINWWSQETDRRFAEKAQCMIDQYSNFSIPEIGMYINGRLTLGENIADNGGIRESFRAYKKYLETAGGAEKLVPGLPYTHEQLFFVGYGQSWCIKMRPEAMKHAMLTYPHSPGRARINVVLSNQPEFAEAFKCPLGSPMNPKKKCSVW